MFQKIRDAWLLKSDTSGTAQYWSQWRKETKKKYPVRYYLQRTLPVKLRAVFVWPLNRALWWVRYRTINRNHIIKIRSLKPSYYDEDTLMLHLCFQLLVDYVEIGLGGRNTSWHDEHPSFWFKRRFPDAGLDYLDWAINDEDSRLTSQAEEAREHKALYLWWTVERPARIDPWSNSRIWGEVEAPDDDDPFGNMHPARVAAGHISSATDEFYALEEQEMLERLVKVRRGMWT